MWDQVLAWIAGVGAIGTAAMGIVQSLKIFTDSDGDGIGTIGLPKTKSLLGDSALLALDSVYGNRGRDTLLAAKWNEGPDKLIELLGNGLRSALFTESPHLHAFIASFGHDAEKVLEAIAVLRKAGETTATTGETTATAGEMALPEARERLARFETAIDARVTAAVTAGRTKYKVWMQVGASLVAVAGCWLLSSAVPANGDVLLGLTPRGALRLAGVLAIPLAPVAKDLVGLVKAARQTQETKQSSS